MRRLGLLSRKLLLVLIVLAMAGGAWGLWHWKAAGDAPARYRTEKVQRGRVASFINASGTLVPEEVIDVGAQVAGKIVAFGPDPDHSNKSIDYGSRVEKNKTVLALIDKALYEPEVGVARADVEVAKADVKKAEADLDAARARSVQAGKDLERAKRMAGGSISPLEFDALQAAQLTAKAAVPAGEANLLRARRNVDRAEQVLVRAQTNLDYTTIRSPVDGVIIDRRVNIGQTVVASLNAPSLFLIATDLRKMQVWASVNEADVGRIRVGQGVAFKVDAFPDDVFAGTVGQVRLNAMNTQNVVTYTVVVNTDNSNLRLLPYLTANVQFHVEHRDGVMTVPNAALRYRPAVERVDPGYRSWYQESRRRRGAATEMKAGQSAANDRGVLWEQDDDGDLVPVQVRLGLTDGSVTEVAQVIEGELGVDDAVVTGEALEKAAGGENPFAVKMFGSGKKKE